VASFRLRFTRGCRLGSTVGREDHQNSLASACYARVYVDVADAYRLAVTSGDRRALGAMLRDC
jgi:hypothetical protein